MPCWLAIAMVTHSRSGQLVGKVEPFAGFGRLLAVGARDDTGHLADFLGQDGHVGQR